MKKPFVILIVAVIAGIAAFGITRRHCAAAKGDTLLDQLPELAWLRKELALSDAQFSKVAELHASYRPVCADMCERIGKSRTRLESAALKHKSTADSELRQAIADYESVRGECKMRMLDHLYQTAALMNGEQSERYLKIVLPAALETAGSAHPHH